MANGAQWNEIEVRKNSNYMWLTGMTFRRDRVPGHFCQSDLTHGTLAGPVFGNWNTAICDLNDSRR